MPCLLRLLDIPLQSECVTFLPYLMEVLFCLPSVLSLSGKCTMISLGETAHQLASVQVVWAVLTRFLPALGTRIGHVTQI